MPETHVALLSHYELFALGAAKGTLDGRRNVVNIDDASFPIKCKRYLQLAMKAKVTWQTMAAVSRRRPQIYDTAQ